MSLFNDTVDALDTLFDGANKRVAMRTTMKAKPRKRRMTQKEAYWRGTTMRISICADVFDEGVGSYVQAPVVRDVLLSEDTEAAVKRVLVPLWVQLREQVRKGKP